MPSPRPAIDADWLGACRRATAGLREMLAARPTTADRLEEAGVGEGGDRALAIDRAAEDVVFAQLDALHAAGARFTAVSEERGRVDFGDPGVLVVIDPIDGSLNAKRGVGHHALSIAVADGPTMADVAFGFVHDFGPAEEWTARRGAGADLNGVRLDPAEPDRRRSSGRLEIIGLESADPRWIAESMTALLDSAHRVRALGTIAVTLCQVAAARFDGMATLKACRSFDAAAAQLIVREAGGLVAFTACADPLGAPLDLLPHSPVVAARSPDGLETVRSIPAR